MRTARRTSRWLASPLHETAAAPSSASSTPRTRPRRMYGKRPSGAWSRSGTTDPRLSTTLAGSRKRCSSNRARPPTGLFPALFIRKYLQGWNGLAIMYSTGRETPDSNEEPKLNTEFNRETQSLIDQLARLAGRPVEAKPDPLAGLVDQLDEVHSELPALLREPGLSDADYDQLWDAYNHISNALSTMVRVQRRGETK